MDVTLHKRCAKFVYVIPEGLRELMSDISREVLRSQPEHMYTFIADYLDALMITRENARVAARLVDSIIRIATMTVELLEQTGMSREEADKMASIIQNAFKKYFALRREPVIYASPQEEEEEEQDMVLDIIHQYGDLYDQEISAIAIIRKAFREFKDRHARERQLLTGMIDWRVAARSAIYLYRKTGVTMEEANRAATLIKAAYKGYYTRRIMKRLVQEGQQIYEEKGEDVEQMFSGGKETTELGHGDVTEEELSVSQLSTEKDKASEGVDDSHHVVDVVLRGVLARVVPDEPELQDVTPPSQLPRDDVTRPGAPPPTEATEHITDTVFDVTITITEPPFPEDPEWVEETGWYEPLQSEGATDYDEHSMATDPTTVGTEGEEVTHEMELEHEDAQEGQEAQEAQEGQEAQEAQEG